MSRRKIMRDAKIRAHLCPFLSRGIISCFVTRLINHSWRVESHKRTGNVIEMRISGIPRKDGLKNWLKKLKFMVRYLVFLVLNVPWVYTSTCLTASHIHTHDNAQNQF
uniref:Uncharacterized protein n=1 Tax=Geospiza parvula TaxID=87175 RepID=A0A8U8B5L3_GEOPR